MLYYKDRIRLTLIAGSGGSGALSFRTSRGLPRGGPDGGDGGDGGRIGFISDPRRTDLSHFKKQTCFKAQDGGAGLSLRRSGRKGKDLTLSAPPGSLLKDEKGEILQDLSLLCRPFFLLKGGKGGKGNGFYKSSVNQAPAQFQKGLAGEKRRVILELKPLTDIALVGQSNTGKSAFFNKATGGKSPEGDYPCSTTAPYYGRISSLSLSLMDVPGLSLRAEHEAKEAVFLRLMGRAKILLIFINSAEPDPVKILKETEERLSAFDRACFKPSQPERERELSDKIGGKSGESSKNRLEESFAFRRKKRILVLSRADQVSLQKKRKALDALASFLQARKSPAAAAGKGALNEGLSKRPLIKGMQGKPETVLAGALSLRTGEGEERLFNLLKLSRTET